MWTIGWGFIVAADNRGRTPREARDTLGRRLGRPTRQPRPRPSKRVPNMCHTRHRPPGRGGPRRDEPALGQQIPAPPATPRLNSKTVIGASLSWVRIPPSPPGAEFGTGRSGCGLGHIRAGLARIWLKSGRTAGASRATTSRPSVARSSRLVATIPAGTAAFRLNSGRSARIWLLLTASPPGRRSTRGAARIWLNRRHGYALADTGWCAPGIATSPSTIAPSWPTGRCARSRPTSA